MESEKKIGIMGTKFIAKTPIVIDEIVKFSKETILKQGELKPQYFIEKKLGKKYERTTLVLLFNGGKEKDAVVKESRKLVDGERCFVMAESWVSERKIDEDMPYIRAGRDINRKEAIIITEYKKDLSPGQHVHLYFKRDNDGKIVSFEKKNMGKIVLESLWNPYIEFDGVKEKIHKQIEKFDEKYFNKITKQLSEKYGPKLMKAEGDIEKKKVMLKMFQEMDGLKSKIAKQMYEDDES